MGTGIIDPLYKNFILIQKYKMCVTFYNYIWIDLMMHKLHKLCICNTVMNTMGRRVWFFGCLQKEVKVNL